MKTGIYTISTTYTNTLKIINNHMQIIETKVYTFDELSEEAKEKARDWYRNRDEDSFFSEYVIEQWKEKLHKMGFDGVEIHYTGFWSQGDGACFTGTMDNQGLLSFLGYHKLLAKFPKIVRSLKKKHPTVHDIYTNIKVTHTGRYYHEYMTNTEDHSELQGNGDIMESRYKDEWTELFTFLDCRTYGGDQGVQDAYRNGTWIVDTNKAIYKDLQAEYEYHNSDEVVAENIMANDYTFTSDGKRF